jgi:hypothetical protein
MRRNIWLLVILLAVWLVASVHFFPPHLELNAPLSRSVKTMDYFFTAAAVNFSEPSLCNKISWFTVDSPGPNFGSSEYDVYSQRSKCYFYTALGTKNATVCDSVRRIITLPSNHSEISRSECLARLQGKPYFNEASFPDVHTLPDLMRTMGYSEEDKRAAQDAAHPLDGPLAKFYEQISKTDAFKDRVRKLHDYNEGYAPDKLRLANHDEILLDIVASDDLVPELCEKISPNSFKEVHHGSVLYRLPVRNDCFFAAAEETLRSDLCSKIVPLDFGPMTLTRLTRERCEYEITQSVRTGLSYRTDHYIHYFDSNDDVVHALQGLGYEKPFLIDEHQFDWGDFYMYLEFDAPSGERQRFVNRVKTLHNY